MATSGSITTGSSYGRSVTLSWSLTSQSVANNTSTIKWTITGSGSASGYVISGGFKATINGTTVYSTSTSTRINLYNGTTVASGSLTIAHNTDGTKSFSLYIEAGVYTYAVNVSASGTHTLTTIPRASSVSATSVNLASASTITISTASSAFTHTLSYTFGSTSGTIASKTSSTSVSWTPPLSLASQIPNAVSGTCTITCDTYSGSTKVGSKTCTLTLTVPSTVKPTLTSITATRVDGDVPSSWGIYVQSKSKATLTINGASGIYGSTISSYSITGGGYTSTASSFTTGYLTTSGTITFTAKVTDSRGRTSDAATVSITVIAYSAPAFSSYLSQRANSSGTLSDDGTYIRAQVSYSYSSCSSKNSVTRATYYKKSSATSWTNASKSFSSGTAFTFGSGTISIESSYDIKYEISDAFTTISIIDTVSTAAVLMDFKAGGKGIAIGKVSETEDCFEVSEDWDVKMYGKLMKQYLLDAIYPVGSIYMSVNSTSPATLFGGTWSAWGSGRVPVGINTSDTNFNTVEKTGGAATHTLTIEQTPAHTHTRGTMNITGSARIYSEYNLNNLDVVNVYTGAFYWNSTLEGTSSKRMGTSTNMSSGSYDTIRNVPFDASRSWTGATSSVGSGQAHNNLQPYITCYMWKRTA